MGKTAAAPAAQSNTITISRITYSIAGQIVAVRVSGDPEAANNGLHYLYGDHLGSTNAIQRQNGAVEQTRYYPFGAYRQGGPSPLTDRGYTGQRENMGDLGLMYYNARYYLPGVGRFLSADTIVPDPQNPQSLNRYAYVLNSPLNYFDPTGYWECAAGDDYDRCVDWVTDLLEMLRDQGGQTAKGAYLWFMDYDQSLIDAGGDGVMFSILDVNLFGFDMQARNNNTIQIDRSYFSKAVNEYKAALLAHEFVHLYQDENTAFSQVGELGAYNVQASILDEFGLPLGDLQNIYNEAQSSDFDFYDDKTHDTLRDTLADFNVTYLFLPKGPNGCGCFGNDNPSYTSLVVAPAQFFQEIEANSWWVDAQ